MSSSAPTQRGTVQPTTPAPFGWLSASLIIQAVLFLSPARQQYGMDVLPFIPDGSGIFSSGASAGVPLAAWPTLHGGICSILVGLTVLPSLTWISISVQEVGRPNSG